MPLHGWAADRHIVEVPIASKTDFRAKTNPKSVVVGVRRQAMLVPLKVALGDAIRNKPIDFSPQSTGAEIFHYERHTGLYPDALGGVAKQEV